MQIAYAQEIYHFFDLKLQSDFWFMNWRYSHKVPKFALDMSIKAELIQFFDEFIAYRLLATIAAGATAAMISSIICYPLDFARTQISGDMGQKYKGILHCWFTVIKNRGIQGCVESY